MTDSMHWSNNAGMMKLLQLSHLTAISKFYLHFYKPYIKQTLQEGKLACTDLTFQVISLSLH